MQRPLTDDKLSQAFPVLVTLMWRLSCRQACLD